MLASAGRTGASLQANGTTGTERTLAQDLCAVLRDVAAFDIRAFEARSREELLSTLCPPVYAWLRRAQSLMTRVLAEREAPDTQPSEPSLAFGHQMDSLVVQGNDSCWVVTDVAFVASLELARRLEQIASLTSATDQAEILTQCDSALRRISKSLSALENALAVVEGRPAQVKYDSELAVSLRVRAAYAKLRTVVLAAAPPDEETLYRRMRAAGTQIAMLVGNDVYPLLRVRDRIQIRELQARILGWLRTPEPRDHLAGTRLWGDLSSFLHMLLVVNRRQELVAHDAALVAELCLRFDTPSPTDHDTLIRAAASLRGLDDELDVMLANAGAVAPRYWIDVLTRLAGQLSRGSAAEWT